MKPRGGRGSRDKGNRVEREIVDRHRELGIHAERYPLSGASRFRGAGHDVDLYLFGRDECPAVAEVKGRKNGGGFVTLEKWLGEYDALFLRRNNVEPLVVFALEDLGGAAREGAAMNRAAVAKHRAGANVSPDNRDAKARQRSNQKETPDSQRPDSQRDSDADPREVLIAIAATQDYWVRTGQRSVDDAFAVLEPHLSDIGEWRPLGATDAARKIYARFNQLMAQGGRIDQILRGRA